MKQNKYSLPLLCMLISLGCLCSLSVQAQTLERSVVASAGQNFSTPTYSLEFTLGEAAAQTFVNEESLSQGFQQEWLVVTAVDDPKVESLEARVYPNPTFGRVNIESTETLQVRIFDAMGKAVTTTNITPGKSEINIAEFAAGFYVLVLQNATGNKTRTFKLQKVE